MLQIEIEKLPRFLMGQEKGKTEGQKEKALMIARQLLKMDFSLKKLHKLQDWNSAN